MLVVAAIECRRSGLTEFEILVETQLDQAVTGIVVGQRTVDLRARQGEQLLQLVGDPARSRPA